jgi:hypothetical protein
MIKGIVMRTTPSNLFIDPSWIAVNPVSIP